MSDKLRYLHEAIERALNELLPMFKHHELTFIARNTNPNADADIIVSNDDLEKVADVLVEYAARDAMRAALTQGAGEPGGERT